MELGRYAPDLKSSGILWVLGAFLALSALNVLTFVLGPATVLQKVNANPLAPVLAVSIFDTPWTICGLLGVVLLFGAVLFMSPVDERRALSAFFVASTITVGILAGAIWDAYYDTTGIVGAGASAIAITAQGVVFALAVFGVIRLLMKKRTRSLGRMSGYWWSSFLLIDMTIILTTVWFVVLLQPIFTPTLEYNWRVHEFGFIMGIAAVVGYEAVERARGKLDSRITIDEMFASFRFDDLAGRLSPSVPKLRVAFYEDPQDAALGDFRPELRQVEVPSRFRGEDYRRVGADFDRSLLHGMVHANLYYSGAPWQHGRPEVRDVFNKEAERAGAFPEP